MTQKLEFAGATDPGRIRSRSEDLWIGEPELGLFVVADGRGGHVPGKRAAKTVVKKLPQLIRTRGPAPRTLIDESLVHTVNESLSGISRAILRRAQNDSESKRMGATVVLAIVRGNRALVAHLGDSRAYLWRGDRLRQLTHDHSLTPSSEIKVRPDADVPPRGPLARYLGMPGTPNPEVRVIELKPHDRLLLCSDGLTRMVSDERILKVLKSESNLKRCCDQLVLAANAAGGLDNITTVLVSVGDLVPVIEASPPPVAVGAATPQVRQIALDELSKRLGQICEDIESAGSVWDVSSATTRFYLVPTTLGKRVLGLYDAKDDLPFPVQYDRNFTIELLIPEQRRHPFLIHEGRCVAVSLLPREYEDILKPPGKAAKV